MRRLAPLRRAARVAPERNFFQKTYFRDISVKLIIGSMAIKRSTLQDESALPRDTRQMLLTARQLLANHRKLTELLPKATGDELAVLEKRCNLLFGTKNSLASSLITLAELIFKIYETIEKPPDTESNTTSSPALSEYDIGLIEAFLNRMQQADS